MATYTDNYAMIKPSLADVADIAAINQNTDKIDQIMHGSQTSLADAYDPAKTYNLRDKVMHDFQLYACLANGTTGTWDPTKWERTTAADTGGNYVDVTENYRAGLNIAVIDIDGDQHEIYVPEMTGATAQAPGTPGLVPSPTPADSGKYLDASGGWSTPSGGGGGGTTVIPNPQGTPTDTLNTIQIGQTVYGIPGSGGEDIADMTWTELVSTTGTSSAVAIPQGTKRLVLTAELGGIVTKVAEEKIENIQKLLDVSLQSTWNMGAEYADTAGNHTNIAMSVNNGLVTVRSGYNTVTAKVYALT